MARNEMREIRIMLEALLKSQGLVEWVSGFVYGATSNGDPYVLLYPAAEHLKEKVCRVYPHQFKKLPAFIPTADIAGDTDSNPDKQKAQARGIYHECQPFQIVMHLGKDTQMGREKRFGGVLYVPARASAGEAGPEPPAAAAPAVPPAAAPVDEKWAHWYAEATTAAEGFLFDTAMARLEPWYQDSNNVRSFRQMLFGSWKADQAEKMTGALLEYAKRRKAINGSVGKMAAHNQAMEAALSFYRADSPPAG